MKNFQVRHGQGGNTIFSETFPLSSKQLLDLLLPGKRIPLTRLRIYPQIYDRTPCPAYLFVSSLLKSKGGVGLFGILQKERLFHLL